MNQKEHIRKVLREDIKRSNYLNIIKEIVEPFKEVECICDIDMRYDDKDDMYSVYVVFGQEELNDKFTYDGQFFYIKKKTKEVKEAIESYLPIKNIFVGSYGNPNCGWKPLNESKEKSKKNLIERVLNDLVLPQYEHIICGFELKNVSYMEDPSIVVTFIGGYGTKMWPQTPGIQKMYDDLLDEIWGTVYDYTGIALQLHSEYIKDCGKENIYLRESKETEAKYLSLIKELVEPFKYEEGVCDIDMWYDDEVGIYMVYLVIGIEEMNEKFTYVPAMNSHISKLKMGVKKTIKQYIPIDNLYVGWYGAPNCEWNPNSK